MFGASNTRIFICAMKTIFTLIILFGAAQFALASADVPESLFDQVSLEFIEGLVLGSIHGSFGLLGALFFGIAVVLRFKRPGR